MTKAVKTTPTAEQTTSIAKRQMIADNKMIRDFMKKRDLPGWYRGLSPFQLKSAEALLPSIRDDREQGTSHRVRENLIRLGLEPVPNHRRINLAMRLSRGNDLAFLWFLLELYYCIPTGEKGHVFSINQQIILSAISHLDTVPTLRALDKLLPKRYIKPVVQKTCKPKKKKVRVANYILPYFKKQTKPKFWSQKLTLEHKPNIPKLGGYETYLDPNYLVANECNRWFSTYKFDKSNRITKRILDEQIENALHKAVSGHAEINTTVCARHEAARRLKEHLLDELRVARKKACEKYFDLDGQTKDQSCKRVVEMLNNEIVTTEAEFRKMEQHYDKGMSGHFEAKAKLKEKREQFKATPKRKMNNANSANYDEGQGNNLTDKSKYFVATSAHKPFKFNYESIFDLGNKNQDPVRDAVRAALTGHSSGNLSLDSNAAVKQCCKEMWKEEVKKFKVENARQEKEKRKQKPPPDYEVLNFDVENINPRDRQVLETMMLAAIKEIQKKKTFVLASLPDAHKTPVLKEWIKKRYGMVYALKGRRRTFETSKKIFHIMKRNGVKVRLPILDDLATNRMVSYACKKYLLRKSDYIRDHYYRIFKDKFMKKARIYWAAVRPYQCSNGPPRNEFFSYLPARENGIYMFKPWRVHECIPAKQQWNRRQLAKRAANMC